MQCAKISVASKSGPSEVSAVVATPSSFARVDPAIEESRVHAQVVFTFEATSPYELTVEGSGCHFNFKISLILSPCKMAHWSPSLKKMTAQVG